MQPILISSGEPAGIGPDLCLALAELALPVVIIGDKAMLMQRAQQLQLNINFLDYQYNKPLQIGPKQLTILSLSCPAQVEATKLNIQNAAYVIEMLNIAASRCYQGEFSALVTAPVHKAIINQAGFSFTGHTEFLAQYFHVDSVVMLLACDIMKIALVTTHLPLKNVAANISISKIEKIIIQLERALRMFFNVAQPTIYVAGLNPHAGEMGYLGDEEITTIIPALKNLKKAGVNVYGPFPADTLFNQQNIKKCDAFVAMYHDQGLAVLKYASFGSAVNITLGLPIIRTSVDHGVALNLAGTGETDAGSLLAAIKMAVTMAAQGKAQMMEQCEKLHD